MMRNIAVALSFIAIASTGLFVAPEAKAATQSGCIVNTIQYDNSQRLAVWCSGAASIIYSFGPAYGTSCSPVSVDTVKLWETMIQSALLSGKKVDLDYTTNTNCFSGTTPIITGVRLQAL
jgi:hypothetical protein